MKKLLILDAGHGGIVNGQYTTQGKKFRWPNPTPEMENFMIGDEWCEGLFNREVAEKVIEASRGHGVDFDIVRLYEEGPDTRLRDRTNIANQVFPLYDHVLFLSIHANASSPSISVPGRARGMELFHHPRSAIGKKFAEEIDQGLTALRNRFQITNRGVKEPHIRYHVLFATHMPAVIFEAAFFDNRADVEIISKPDYIEQLGKDLIQSVSNMFQSLGNPMSPELDDI